MLKKAIINKKGQITIDAILAILFILAVSTMIYYDVFNTVGHFRDVEIADRAYSIADSFENYALLSYSKDVRIVMELKPVGSKNYTIYFANKKISVNTEKTVIFIPSTNGVIIDGDYEYSGKTIPNNIINISFGDFYIVKNTSIDIE
jgi:uncharacterized protein (UPF0333 family)